MIKSIAFLKATGNPKVDKAWGQLRHALGALIGFLSGFGILSRYGIEIPNDSLMQLLVIGDNIVDLAYSLFLAFGGLVVLASSFYSKD